MPTELLLDYLAGNSRWKRMQFQMVYQCAPVLKGVKASNIITLPSEIWKKINKTLAGTSISWMILASDEKKDIILLYRRDWLEYILDKEEVRKYIRTFGYYQTAVEEVLTELQLRYQLYLNGLAEFPHEVGILLQYPLRDVKDFIASDGKNSIISGYWKVYHNPGAARRIFAVYDCIREKAAKEFMAGVEIREICKE